MDSGKSVRITDCPNRYVGDDMIDFVNLIQHFEQGRLPVGGGVLDQTANFHDAARLFKSAIRELHKSDT